MTGRDTVPSSRGCMNMGIGMGTGVLVGAWDKGTGAFDTLEISSPLLVL